VSSVATGITTVSLLDQAPEPVSRTINRVVERTIEKVVDPVVDTVSNVTNNKDPERIVETVVVNQEELTVDAVEKNSKSLVRIYSLNSVTGAKTFAGLGVVVSTDGKILTSSTILESGRRFYSEYPDGGYEVSVSGTANNGAVIFSPKEIEEGKTFSAATFGNSQNIKLGQSVISLSGQDKNSVSTGIVNSLETGDSETVNLISTSISADSIIRGSILINLKGEIVGMRIAGSSGSSYVASNIIKSLITI
jgi:hypothetical protein